MDDYTYAFTSRKDHLSRAYFQIGGIIVDTADHDAIIELQKIFKG